MVVKPPAAPLMVPTVGASLVAEAVDEIREAFHVPRNTLFLHPKQMEVYASTCRFKVVVAGRRWGKALALDTPIPTPHGWTTMGELRDGDEVFDESGKPCRVTHAHAVMHGRPCYEIEFSDGTKVVADEEHLWSTWDKAARKNVRRNPSGAHGAKVRTTRQIIDTLTAGTKDENNHSIPCAGAVQYPEARLRLDPYMLGAWLGDGDSRCAALTCGDEELPHFSAAVEKLIGAKPHMTQDPRTGAWRVAITGGRGCEHGFQKGLRELNLLANKHIPRAYLQGSVAQRLALMQGLMDTDGSIFEHAGNCEFTSVNKRLADDVLELALSLGIKATLITGTAKLNGRDCGAKYRVRFTTAMQVFRLPRKAEKNLRARKFRVDHRFIVAVRPVESVPVRCITVDSPNALYLCSRAFIATHNTQLAKVSLIKFARKKKRLVWYVAPSYRMAKQIMWPELVESIPRAWVKKYNETILTITLVNGTKIELKGADNPDSLRGVGIHYLVMDEVQDIDPEAWTKVLRPTLASTGGHALFIGTPKAYNFLHQLWSLGQKEEARAWQSWQFPTITSPFIPLEEIEAAREDMDEKSFKQEFEASFETMSGRVYHAFDRKVHAKRELAFDPTLPIWIGQDFNIDPMSSVVFQKQRNGELWAIDEIVLPSSNTYELCDELERRYWRYLDQITIYPDPAGAYRGHQRGESDLDIFRERGFKRQKYRRKHPPVADRVNAVNRLLMSANGTVKMYVDPRCKHFINALEQTLYVPGSREVDKKAGVEHAADAGGYCIEFEFPTRKIEILGVSL